MIPPYRVGCTRTRTPGQNLHRVCYNDVDRDAVLQQPPSPASQPATHLPATLLSHSSVSTAPPPLNPPSKQPSIITKAPALYVRIAPIHPPSKGLISALPLELVLLPPLRKRRATPSRLTREPRISMRPILYWFALNSRLFFLNRSSPSNLGILPGVADVPAGSITGVVIGNCRINYKL